MIVEEGYIKNDAGVKRELRGKRYTVTGKAKSGNKIGTIEGKTGVYLLLEYWLEPDSVIEKG